MTHIRRSLFPVITGMLVCIAVCFNSGAAHAQCRGITVTNNINCSLVLCLYSLTGVSPECWSIPTGAPTVITFPAGFVPAGGYSAGNNSYPFVHGCTRCYAFLTTSPTQCCGVVCYDAAACTIMINPCTSEKCAP